MVSLGEWIVLDTVRYKILEISQDSVRLSQLGWNSVVDLKNMGARVADTASSTPRNLGAREE